ncbi:hypothetical protein HAX54_025726 [Datura stramonium]|uniref:Protein kinase domain-containing protein n=1 Tax=Datura stramonium TaxID=4076 RepID=A0ABS8V2V6_DATST|nr:hypothetical protein [Datura stramonium]
MQNPRNPFTYRTGIGSSSSLPNDYQIGKTIIDPITGDTYVLKKEIGSSCNGFCRVYRALYSKRLEENGILVQSDSVTLKTINKNFPECEELQLQVHTSISNTPHSSLIGLNRAFTTNELVCVSLPYMSEGSLRYILSTRPNKKLTQDFIAVVLKEALVGIQDLHAESNPRAHKTLNAGDIFISIHDVNGEMLIKLAFEASRYHSEIINTEKKPNLEEASSSSSFLDPKIISEWAAAPEVFGSENGTSTGPKSDIWLLGITALELAYGVLPVRNREDLECIIKKIREKKKLPKSLEKLLIHKEGKFKKVLDLVKPKKKVFSEEFEKMVLACLCENPENRPTADQLLDTPFFTTAIERLKKFVLDAFQGVIFKISVDPFITIVFAPLNPNQGSLNLTSA